MALLVISAPILAYFRALKSLFSVDREEWHVDSRKIRDCRDTVATDCRQQLYQTGFGFRPQKGESEFKKIEVDSSGFGFDVSEFGFGFEMFGFAHYWWSACFPLFYQQY